MSIFDLSDGKAVDSEITEFDGGTDFELLPDGLGAKARISDVSWETPQYAEETFIKVKWQILAPDEYKGRVVFQKLKVYDPKPTKSDRAKMMFGAINANCGNPIGRNDDWQDDMVLKSGWANKFMWIRIAVWDIDGKRGNWVRAVSKAQLEHEKPTKTTNSPKAGPVDDDIPF